MCVYGVGVGVAHAALVKKKLSFILNEITLQLEGVQVDPNNCTWGPS